MALVLPRVARPVPATGHTDPVDTQRRAVEDHVGLPAGNLDRFGQRGCHRGEGLDLRPTADPRFVVAAGLAVLGIKIGGRNRLDAILIVRDAGWL